MSVSRARGGLVGVALFACIACVACVVAGVSAACGLDAEGSADADGGSTAADASPVPTACATLDAACLGPLPAIWQPLSLGATCASGFQPAQLYENPRERDGGCACGACTVVGAFSCNGMTPVKAGDSCNDSPIANAAPDNCTQASAEHIEGRAPKATGLVGCFAPNDGGAGAAADPLAVCVPGCDADFCAGPSRCIMAEGIVACPNGFQLRSHAGAGVSAGCAPCPCESAPPGNCTGTITAYESSSCADAGRVNSYALDTCNNFPSGKYGAVRVKLTPPAGTCKASPIPRDGIASLTGEKTICCR